MKKIPFKYNREGAWSSSHPFHYRCAYEVFADFEKLIQTLNEKEIELQNENPEMDPEELWSYIHYETDMSFGMKSTN